MQGERRKERKKSRREVMDIDISIGLDCTPRLLEDWEDVICCYCNQRLRDGEASEWQGLTTEYAFRKGKREKKRERVEK